MVLLEGEAGIGKSRLMQALRDQVGGAAAVVQRYQCSPYLAATAFHPVSDLLERAARFSPEDDAETKLDKLERTVGGLLPADDPALTLIAALLSLPVGRHRRLDMTAPEQRARTIGVVVAQLTEACVRAGRPEEGLTWLGEATAYAAGTGERFWHAELHRLGGELLLARSSEQSTEAEADFRDALEIARRQEARSFELRAATGLARLYHESGRRGEALELLVNAG